MYQRVFVVAYYFFIFPISIMKKFLSSLLVFSFVFLVGCASDAPMTEEQQAAKYGITVEQFRAEKRAAARMNMSLEEHMKMLDAGDDMQMMHSN